MKLHTLGKANPLPLRCIYFRVIYVVCLMLFLHVACSGPQNATQHTISGQTMGTTFTVKIMEYQASDLVFGELEARINELLKEVNRQMSTYIPDSELSQFNQYRKTDWFPISKDLAIVLDQSLKISEMSGGAFDVTVGPLVNLWGFGPEEREGVPDGEEIAQRLAQTGYKRVKVRLSPPAVRKDLPEIYCDLSAIAKGFGVDKIADYLEGLGIDDYLVEIGGEVRAKGHNDKDQPWRIGVQSPRERSTVNNVIKLQDRSVATSGDYMNYFEKDGVRYSHTIDPKTGRPITHKLASVTVIHESCMIADGMATAINVLGPIKGYAFAMKNQLAVLMLVKTDEGFIEQMTPDVEALMPEQ